MIGFHLQGNVDDWTDAVARLPAGAPVKFIDGVQRATEAKAANHDIHVNIRHHVHEQNPTGDMHEQARRFFASFVDESFRQCAWAIDSVGELNEYFSDSQNERQRWIDWIQACVDVWRDEYRTQREYEHIDLTLAATAVGNNIPLAVAKIAHDNPFCILDYHNYIPVYRGRMSPEHWRWYSGRWDSMDKVYRYHGYHVRWLFGEFGAVGINGEPDEDGVWPNSLAPMDGWRKRDVYNGNVGAFCDMMTEWCSLLEDTPAWKEGRVIGAVLFTSGGGSLWKHFEVKQPEMNVIADHVRHLRKNMIAPGEPEPPPPPEPPIDPIPPMPLGLPRIQYARTVHVVPQQATLRQFLDVATEAYLQKNTVGFSHDDAGIGALKEKTAVLWDIAEAEKDVFGKWYDANYPQTQVQFENYTPAPPTIPPPGQVVDISHWNGDIDWQKMKEANVTHVYIKCTDGINWLDPHCEVNADMALFWGITWGLYHYYRNHQDGLSQARWFLNNRPGGMTGGLPPVIDIETSYQTAPLDINAVQRWLGEVQMGTGRRPVIYTSEGAWESMVTTPQPWASEYNLWVANYTSKEEPALPRDWDDWWLWQYGKVPGEPFGLDSGKFIDVNRFNADSR